MNKHAQEEVTRLKGMRTVRWSEGYWFGWVTETRGYRPGIVWLYGLNELWRLPLAQWSATTTQ